MERLDRIYSNEDWLNALPNVTITHLPKAHSNHNLILINLNNRINFVQNKSFRLETFWCAHPVFINLVSISWENKDLVGEQSPLKSML